MEFQDNALVAMQDSHSKEADVINLQLLIAALDSMLGVIACNVAQEATLDKEHVCLSTRNAPISIKMLKSALLAILDIVSWMELAKSHKSKKKTKYKIVMLITNRANVYNVLIDFTLAEISAYPLMFSVKLTIRKTVTVSAAIQVSSY